MSTSKQFYILQSGIRLVLFLSTQLKCFQVDLAFFFTPILPRMLWLEVVLCTSSLPHLKKRNGLIRAGNEKWIKGMLWQQWFWCSVPFFLYLQTMSKQPICLFYFSHVEIEGKLIGMDVRTDLEEAIIK